MSTDTVLLDPPSAPAGASEDAGRISLLVQADCVVDSKKVPRLSPRFASLDALRAGMMLLGILLHVANGHAVGAPGWWPVHDNFRLGLFDALTFCVHAFRMEIFFLLAGFFARLLLIRHGEAGFAANRVRRVLLPWGIGVALMLAAMSLGMLPAATTPRELPTTFPAYVSAEPVEAGTALDQWHPWFRHLWFLEYLLIFYLVLVVLSRVMVGREDRWLKAIDAWLFRAMRRQWLPLLLAAMTAPFLLPMASWVVPTPLSLVPDWRLLMYYGLFVGCGWMLHRQPSVLTAAAAHWNWRVGGIHMAVGLALFGLLWNVGGVPQDAAVPFALAIRLASALFTWLFVFQIVGAAVLLLNRQNPALRYLADAAYWCYLVHLPIVFVLQQQVAPSLPGLLRFPAVLAITAVVSLGSYQLFVRCTFLRGRLGSRGETLSPRHFVGSSTSR